MTLRGVAAAALAWAASVAGCAGGPTPELSLIERMRPATYVLLGEVHDNAEQHRQRADLLRELLADAHPTWVVFEQIDREYTAAVAAAPRNVDAIVAAGQLNVKGWGWPLHRPLFEAALAGGAVIVGGNLGRAELSPVVRQGDAGLPPELRRWFDGSMPAGVWSLAQTELMLRLVDEGHCKALPASMMAPMALAQRARDAALAQAMLQAPAGVRVVLVAGNGHVRRDVGVPRYLEAAGVAARGVLSIGFEERDTAVPAPGADPRYDVVRWTPAVVRTDPCERFRPSGGTRSSGPSEGRTNQARAS